MFSSSHPWILFQGLDDNKRNKEYAGIFFCKQVLVELENMKYTFMYYMYVEAKVSANCQVFGGGK